MKRMLWWTLIGISGAAVPALWLGQSVLGQPELKEATPFVVPQPAKPANSGKDAKKPSAAPVLVEVSNGIELTAQPALPTPELRPLPSLGADPAPTVPPLVQTESRVARSEVPGVPLDVQPGKQQPSVSIEWVGPATIRINQPVAFHINVRNTSAVAVHNVVVRHRLGDKVVCNASSPKATQEAGELVWNLGTLAPEQARKIDVTLLPQTRGTLNCHATATFTAVAGHQVQVREPKLAIKMRAPEKAVAGETVNFVVTLTNPGDGIAEAVRVKTLLPEGLEHATGRRVIEFDVGNLAPKETRSMQLPLQAKGNGTQKCMIVATGDGSLTSNDSAQIDILVPKLDVVLSGPKLRYLDRRAVYVLKITNPGSAPAANVEVQELIPNGFKFQQANFGGQFQEATRLVTWNLGDLPPGKSKDVAVELIPIEAGDHRLIAHVKSARGLKSEAEVRTVVEGLPSLFIEVGHVDDPLEVGAETAYEIRVANTGTKTETNVEVVCTLPDQLQFKGAKCTTTLRYRQEGRDLIFEPLPRLAPKADVIYRVQVKGIAPGDVRFRTRVRADGLKDPVSREESTRIYSDDVTPRTSASPSVPATPNVNVPKPAPSAPAPVSPSSTVPAPSVPAPATLPAPLIPPVTGSQPMPLIPPVSVPSPTAPLPMPVVTPVAPPLPSPPVTVPASTPSIPVPPVSR